jgi:hypothetical protein
MFPIYRFRLVWPINLYIKIITKKSKRKEKNSFKLQINKITLLWAIIFQINARMTEAINTITMILAIKV